MSMIYWLTGESYTPKYEKSLTKQSFKDASDINKILQMYQKTGAISHLAKYQAQYGDFEQFDFLEANLQITKGKQIFGALPSELRNEFDQSPSKFFAFVNDPKNKDDLPRIFPELAKPGRYALDASGRTPPGASMDPNAADPDPVVPPNAPDPVESPGGT